MKRLFFLCVIVLGLMMFTLASGSWSKGSRGINEQPVSTANVKGPHIQSLAVPLYFIPNQGQVQKNAQFYARTSSYTLWLTKEGLVFDSIKKVKEKEKKDGKNLFQSSSSPGSLMREVSHLVFCDAHQDPEMVPVAITGHQVNYLNGKDRSDWFTGIKTSKAVLYKSLYKKIDLKVYGIEKQIEYDWIVNTGGNPDQIHFQYKNVTGSRIDEKGNLVIETRLGRLIHKRPVSYQVIEGKRIKVNVEFREISASANEYGFRVGCYDTSHQLIIDPVVLVYSTYLGGTNDDNIFAMTVNGNGYAYVTGTTFSTNFPVKNGYQNAFGGGNRDAFIVKFSPTGSNQVYSTYLGGSGNDTGEGIQVDSSGQAYVTGFTNSTDFPTKNAYQDTYGGGDADVFVAILYASGSGLVYSSYLGGNGLDEAYAIALDSSKNMYLTGLTGSTNFPTLNAFRDTFTGGGQNEFDAFITKIASSGSSLIYSTYLGGSGRDAGYGIAVNGTNAYVSGRTSSTNFPTKNEFQDTYGGGNYDAFLTKLSTAGNTLIYSTFLGGSGTDSGWGVAVDDDGRAHVTGATGSTNFPTEDAYQSAHGGGTSDAFLTKFASTGTNLAYSTYLGGAEPDASAHMVLNSSGYAYLVGYTSSSDFPVKRAYQNTYNGDLDVMAAMFTPDGSNLGFSTFLGGSGRDSGRGIALDNSGNIYLAGYTESSDFPTENAFQGTAQGGTDGFITKLSTSQFGTLCGAVDNCDLNWTTSGNADWFEQVSTYYNDGDAAQSGVVGESQSSNIRTTVTGPGELNFWWKVSSYYYYGKLKFYIDDQEQDQIYGTGGDWQQETYSITEGAHTLKWSYEKTSSWSYGEDCGWLDKVEFTPETSIVLDRNQLTFGAVAGNTTGPQTFSISNPTGGALDWTASDNKDWLSFSPTSGTSGGVVTVSVDATGLPAGVYSGDITISAANASNTPETVSVILNVYKSGNSSVPFGTYETPTNNSTIMSSVPFTGWVLDDLGVQSVKLYRKSGNSLIYIGDGVFVEGARPDVEQAYPDYPYNYRAGWGYMMLTNFLPDGGNGTFNIEAIATDIEGHQVSLGTKTVTVDNDSAVKPFGAIDTPTQGGTASGAGYVNWGWVLTPQPNEIDTDGSTIKVWVDGVNLGNPTYNIYRSDIAGLFPGYANTNGAAGYFKIDTTAYENGVHTLQWTATDSGGNTDGIGSRYFTVQNSSTQGTQSTTQHIKQLNPTANLYRRHHITPGRDVVLDTSNPVGIKKGYNTEAEHGGIEMTYPNEQGVIAVETRELDRVEIQFSEKGESRDLYGWLVVGNQFRRLPAGTYIDRDKGTFCWQIGMVYKGKYHLFFIEEDRYGNRTGRNVFVNIASRY